MRRIRRIKRSGLNKYPGAILIIALIALLAYSLGFSKLFIAGKVELKANGTPLPTTAQINTAEALALSNSAELYIGMPLARVNVKQVALRLQSLDWVAAAAVNRDWLGRRINLVLTLRQPIFEFTDGASTRFVDSKGNIFAPADGSSVNLPLLSFDSNQINTKDAIAALLGYYRNFEQGSWPFKYVHKSQLGSLNFQISGPDSLTTTETDKGGQVRRTIVWGSANNLDTKRQVLNQLEQLPENKKVLFYDLSDPATPIVK